MPTTFQATGVESERGDAEKAFAGAAVKLDQTYVTPDGDAQPDRAARDDRDLGRTTLTSTRRRRASSIIADVLAQMLGVPKENVRVITKFLGSGFGGKLWPWTHCAIAAAAAREARASR